MSFNCKKLVCVLLAVITVIAMTSVVAFAENEVSESAQEVSATDSSTAENADTIFEIFNRGEGTFMERLVHGGKVTLVGMLVVFAVLIVLMVILYVFQLIFGRKSKKAEEKPVEKTVSAPAPAAAPVAAPAAANQEEELVAVATAAIAAARGESDCAFNVISITQIN